VVAASLKIKLLGNSWLNPELGRLNQAQHKLDATPTARAAAAKSFGVWQGVFQALNVFMLAAVTGLLWRTSNPSDAPRYVSSGKFRS